MSFDDEHQIFIFLLFLLLLLFTSGCYGSPNLYIWLM